MGENRGAIHVDRRHVTHLLRRAPIRVPFLSGGTALVLDPSQARPLNFNMSKLLDDALHTMFTFTTHAGLTHVSTTIAQLFSAKRSAHALPS